MRFRGDAYIAPSEEESFLFYFRQLRNISKRADVGIGPYDFVIRIFSTEYEFPLAFSYVNYYSYA